MKTKKEIKDWLLENAVDEDGELELGHLDFSDFNGDIYIGNMKVKGNLFQKEQEVGGDFITQALKEDEEYKIDEYEATYIVKKTKKYTYEELKEKLGHDFEIVEED